jgi:putative NADH-flavin reductase
MTTVAIFGGTGYAGGAIAAEAVKRGLNVISISRAPGSEPAVPGVDYRQGSVHDATLVDRVAGEADVIVVSIRHAPGDDGVALIGGLPALSSSIAKHGKRLGWVGGAATLLVADGGPRLLDTPEFPDAYKGEASAAGDLLEALRADTTGVDWFFVSPAAAFGSYNPGIATGAYRVGGDLLLTDADGKSEISGADFALAIVDEITSPRHHRTRFTVAY